MVKQLNKSCVISTISLFGQKHKPKILNHHHQKTTLKEISTQKVPKQQNSSDRLESASVNSNRGQIIADCTCRVLLRFHK